MPERLRVRIRGAVQGVGFRPFVYRLARELSLGGCVANDAGGVVVDVEGPGEALRSFLRRVADEKPWPASIEELETESLTPTGCRGFRIAPSREEGSKSAQVLPDIATCAACLEEVRDPDDRRWRYPFTNCTHCGPRFSIVRAIPYDRPHTTMAGFAMCGPCRAEYDDPSDRRFHAQPNACPACGPALQLRDRSGRVVARRDAALRGAARALSRGTIVAVKGLGGFHLMVDARDTEAIARLRAGKPRREKPLALMVPDLDGARALCRFDAAGEAALASAEAPILLLPRRRGAPVSESVAPGNPCLGIMLPYTPLHRLLLDTLGRPIVATSGNRAEEPICTDEQEALRRLSPLAEMFLVHDRPIARHVDDSVAWIVDGAVRVLRRARGYSPRPVLLREPAPTLLAVGAHLKNAVALSVGRRVFLSQHIGDMETPEALAAFERVIGDFLRLYEARPVAVAHDLHPDYVTTRWARAAVAGESAEAPAALGGVPLVAVQHHHAHLAACLAENEREGAALGVCWDGTGYGPDGTVWGGELLVGDAARFRRLGSLRPFRLPGGEAAVREPRRAALGLLWELEGDAVLGREELAPVRSFSARQRQALGRLLAEGVRAPRTTSAGRLFDGVAALLGLHQTCSFEAQAAMALEHAVDPTVHDRYPAPWSEERGKVETDPTAPSLRLDWGPLLAALLEDLAAAVPTGRIAARFHNALAAAIAELAEIAGEPRVALSGGCFQNRALLERTAELLRRGRFEVLLHRHVPPNDGGIALGQIAVAAARRGPAEPAGPGA